MLARLASLLALALAVGACAQHVLPSHVSQVALFKNGYACIVREVTIPPGDAIQSLIADVPAPVHGSFWVITPGGITLRAAVAQAGDTPVTVPATSLAHLLRANIGEQLDIRTREDGWVAGTLLAMPEQHPEHTAPGMDLAMSARAVINPGHPSEDILILETADGQLAVPVSQVFQVRKRGGGALHTTLTRTAPGATLTLTTAGTGGVAQIAYLTQGISWAPSYRLELHGGNTARLMAKAVIINDAEDMDPREVACIAGFPHIKFARVPDPLSMTQTLAQFFAALQNPTGNPAMSNSVLTQVTYNDARPLPPGPAALPEFTDEDDDGAGDLHLYRLGGFSVRKGGRAYVPIFDTEVPCKEIYRWDVRDGREDRFRHGYGSGVPQAEEVWHTVRVTNTGTQVWTTAPILIADGDNFVAQDIMPYTSPGSSTVVTLTKAIDVKVTVSEQTVDARNTTIINKETYKIYVIAGRMRVTNLKRVPVHLVITNQISGDLIATAPKPGAVTEAPRTSRVNARRTAVWEVDVPAGKTQEITYQYKVYLR